MYSALNLLINLETTGPAAFFADVSKFIKQLEPHRKLQQATCDQTLHVERQQRARSTIGRGPRIPPQGRVSGNYFHQKCWPWILFGQDSIDEDEFMIIITLTEMTKPENVILGINFFWGTENLDIDLLKIGS